MVLSLRAEGGARRGNMGHLTRMANMVVQNLEKGPVQSQISDLIKGMCVFDELPDYHFCIHKRMFHCRLLCLGECSELELVCDIAELPEDCRGRWESFVDETLRETNRRNTVELVSTIQSPSSVSLQHT